MERAFTMQEFKTAWFAFKETAPHPFSIRFLCEDGITRWLCKPGIAGGIYGHTIFGGALYTLYRGTGVNPVRSHCPFSLFEQEQYVYRIEMRDHIRRALRDLFKVNPLPRNPGHAATDTTPYEEDFTAFAFNQMALRSRTKVKRSRLKAAFR